MKTRIRMSLFAALACLLLAVGSASAATIPGAKSLDYAVLRDGSPIGTHVIRFTPKGDALAVDIKTDVKVKLAFVTVYHFLHDGHEVWRDGKLVALQSTTDDDGTDHTMKVSAGTDGLQVLADGTQSTAKPDIIPASLWNPGMVKAAQNVVLNTLDGTKMDIAVDDRGEETVAGTAGPVQARHYVLTGDLKRELWYDPDGVLVKVRFKGSDGSDIEYVLGQN